MTVKPEEIYREAFDLYVKGYRVEMRPGKNKGEYTAFQIRLEDEAKNKDLFGKLRKAIPQKITKQIDMSNKRCFLIVGKDEDLIDGTISLTLHAAKYKARLSYGNCMVKEGEQIKLLFSDFVNGGAVFLRNATETVFRQITAVARDCERRDWHSFLFVTVENSPEVIPSQFKPIYLETTVLFEDETLTVIVNGKKYTSLQDYEYKFCKLLYENRGLLVDFGRIRKEVFLNATNTQQIHNAKSSIEKKLYGYVRFESKRGVGYMMV